MNFSIDIVELPLGVSGECLSCSQFFRFTDKRTFTIEVTIGGWVHFIAQDEPVRCACGQVQPWIKTFATFEAALLFSERVSACLQEGKVIDFARLIRFAQNQRTIVHVQISPN